MNRTHQKKTEAETVFSLPAGSFPFVGSYVQVEGAHVHYVRTGQDQDQDQDKGQRPTLVFLHGNPTWSFLYRNTIAALSDDYECIAIDLPGFGLSPPPAGFDFLPQSQARIIAQTLSALDVTDACLIAHDWGGPIGLWAMFNGDPGRLTRFCLGNTWAWPVNGDFHFEWFSRLMGGAIGRWANERHTVFVNQVIPASMKRGKPSAAVMQAYRAPFAERQKRAPLHIFPREILGSRSWLSALEQKIAAFTGPAGFIWPDNDIAFRDTELKKWLTLLPQAQADRVANCGHYLWEDATEEVNEKLKAQLKRLFAVS